jgi:hypothetical protein
VSKSKTPRRRKNEVIVRRTTQPVGPLVSQLADALRTAAERLLDIADAAAEAVTSRLKDLR